MGAPSSEAVDRHPHLAVEQPAGSVRVDLHTHTMWSGDSTTTPDEFAAAVTASGLDVVCITDHNAVAGAVELAARLDCRVIVGEELRTAAGEIIGLFLAERIPMGVGHLDAAKAIRDQGGVVYIPHPFDPMRRNMTEPALYELAEADLIDAVEVLNAKTSLASLNRRAAEFADRVRDRRRCGQRRARARRARRRLRRDARLRRPHGLPRCARCWSGRRPPLGRTAPVVVADRPQRHSHAVGWGLGAGRGRSREVEQRGSALPGRDGDHRGGGRVDGHEDDVVGDFDHGGGLGDHQAVGGDLHPQPDEQATAERIGQRDDNRARRRPRRRSGGCVTSSSVSTSPMATR